MSLTHPATLKLMEALAEAGPEGAHREALVRQAEISTATFYRALEPLHQAGLLHEHGGLYTLPMSHPYNYAFKCWSDQSRLLQLPAPLREELYGLVDRIAGGLGSNLLALWLVGSAAQQTMHAGSDLDLVGVVRAEQESDPTGSRPVQLTLYPEPDFREALQSGDNFVRALLAHGILLCDRGFAQPLYAHPAPPASRRTERQRDEQRQQLESKVYFFLREEALPEARQCLATLAVSAGRGMLEPLGELPAGKPDLLAGLGLYFGEAVEELVRTCLDQQAERDEILRLLGRLRKLQERIGIQASLLARLGRSLSGSPAEFEVGARQMLDTLFPGQRVETGGDFPADCRLLLGRRTVDWEFMSRVGNPTSGQLDQAAGRGAQILVLNALRELPPRQRPPLSAALQTRARQLGLVVLDSRELFQFHNQVVVFDPPPSSSAWLKRRLAPSRPSPSKDAGKE